MQQTSDLKSVACQIVTALVVSKGGRTSSVEKEIVGLLFKYEQLQRLQFRKGEDIFSLEIDWRIIIQIQIATAVVFSKRGGHQLIEKKFQNYYSNTNSDSACCFEKKWEHLQLNKRLKDYYSNTNSDSACRFEKGRTSAVEKEIEGLLFKYEQRQRLSFRKGEDIFSQKRD